MFLRFGEGELNAYQDILFPAGRHATPPKQHHPLAQCCQKQTLLPGGGDTIYL